MFKPRWFSLQELVHPSFLTYPDNILWSRFHAPYLATLDSLRDRYGAIVINGVYKGQLYQNSGARPFDTTIGAALSMHKLWAAFDLKFMDLSPEEVMMDILSHEANWGVIGRMEDARQTKTWLHIDFGNRSTTRAIHIFKP